ncbi:threonine/serine exporter ThrE family protein [Streptomyces sp. NPDC087300]|uniref:threonine/serine ThrE exporter family protein n=1 Tax=Streptomyces sp. NPDC087300 TaxID=3365780 RepID=UPI0037FFC901
MARESLPWLQGKLCRMRGLEPDPDPALPPPDDPWNPDTAFVIALALMIGEALIANGASAEETAAGMMTTAESFGLHWCEPNVTMWVVSLSGRMPGDARPLVEQRVIRRRTTDFTALEQTHRLVEDISRRTMPAAEARERAIALSPPPDGAVQRGRAARWGLAAGHSGAVAASGSLVAGGDLLVVAPSFVAATLAGYLTNTLSALGVLPFYRFALAAMPAAIFAYLAELLGHGEISPAIIVGGVLSLLPTLTMVGAVQDALTGHYLTAYARVMDAALVFVAIVAGIGVVLVVATKNGQDLPLLSHGTTIEYFSWRFVGAAAFAVAIASRMRVPPRQWLAVMVLGAGGVMVYVMLRDVGYSRMLTTGFVTVGISLAGRLVARRTGMSALPLVIPAVTPLLPGSVLYRALSELAVRDSDHGVTHLVQAIALMVVLATGVSFGNEAAYFFRQLRRRWAKT